MNCEVQQRSHLIRSLICEAKMHITKAIKHNSMYDEIMVQLNGRYNDKLIMGAQLFDRVFLSEKCSNPCQQEIFGIKLLEPLEL